MVSCFDEKLIFVFVVDAKISCACGFTMNGTFPSSRGPFVRQDLCRGRPPMLRGEWLATSRLLSSG